MGARQGGLGRIWVQLMHTCTHADCGDATASNRRTLVTGVRQALAQARFSQNPCLECSEENADTPFLLP